MQALPIHDIEQDFLQTLKRGNRLILSAPTGSGKSTQIPQFLLKHGWLERGLALVLQPRRLAARMLAARVATELNAPLGATVGYQIRFENRAGRETRIKFVTEGVLLRQMIQDPQLNGVQVLVFDEFHERNLYADISLAQALRLQADSRPDLKLIVMSATLDQPGLQKYLAPCEALNAEGRMHPVEVEYTEERWLKRLGTPWDQASEGFAQFVRQMEAGNVLVFMPGYYEIQKTIQAIKARPESKGYQVLPLFSDLDPKDQDAAVAESSRPKVIVSTNVAETSLTIQGVRLVIDGGLARVARYDPRRGVNTLYTEKISLASADQRAGRAGRTAPGRCLRLWTQQENALRPAHQTPEIKRLDLSEILLSLKAAGVREVRSFPLLDSPNEGQWQNAETLLAELGALDDSGELTETGRRMLAFPLHPRFSKMLITAQTFDCVQIACLAAALTQDRDLLLRKADKDVKEFRERLFEGLGESDVERLIKAWDYAANQGFKVEACRRAGVHAMTARQAAPLFQQFLRIAQRQDLDVAPKRVQSKTLSKCILSAFPDRLARRLDQGTLRCEIIHGGHGELTRESAVQKSPLFVFLEAREIETPSHSSAVPRNRQSPRVKSVQVLLDKAAAIDREDLSEMFPGALKTEVTVRYDPSARRVFAEEREHFRGLTLQSKTVEPPPPEAAAPLLAQHILDDGLVLKDWDAHLDNWILRLNRLAEWCPELELPPINQQEKRQILQHLCESENAYTYRQVRDLPVKAKVQDWLNASQRDWVDKQAPERILLPNGRKPKVHYHVQEDPHVAIKIQDLYDVHSLPKIACGKIELLIHILAPNMRPVQMTKDLANFWKNQYPSVKSSLQKKYPKHEWR